MVGEDDPATNPFGHAVSNLKKQREAFVKKKKIEAEEEQAALAKEQQELAKKREEQLVEAKSVLVMDARSAIERIKPEDYIEPGSISFTSEAFAWFAEDGMEGFRFAPEFLAVAFDDGKIRLCDPMTLEHLRTMNEPDNEGALDFHCIAFSSDGELLASACDGTLELWNPSTGELVRRLSANRSYAFISLAFSPTERTLASMDAAGEILLWDIENGSCEFLDVDGTFGFGVEPSDCFAFSPDGTKIAAGNDGGELRIWDVETGEHQTIELRELADLAGQICAVGFDNTSKTLYAGVWNKLARIRLKNSQLAGVFEDEIDKQMASFIRTVENGLYRIYGRHRRVVYCAEFDFAVSYLEHTQEANIYHFHVKEALKRLDLKHEPESFALSPSPHPDLSTIFTEVKFMLKDVGFILSTDDGIHFGIRWESES